jgi:carbon storage regulator CsrA
MLILRVAPGGHVYIGDNIVVTVLGFEDGSAKLGFKAPPAVNITRSKLLTAEQRAEYDAKAATR